MNQSRALIFTFIVVIFFGTLKLNQWNSQNRRIEIANNLKVYQTKVKLQGLKGFSLIKGGNFGLKYATWNSPFWGMVLSFIDDKENVYDIEIYRVGETFDLRANRYKRFIHLYEEFEKKHKDTDFILSYVVVEKNSELLLSKYYKSGKYIKSLVGKDFQYTCQFYDIASGYAHKLCLLPRYSFPIDFLETNFSN